MEPKNNLKRINCRECDEVFYIEIDTSPLYCPHCRTPISSSSPLVNTHKCKVIGASFTSMEAQEISPCGALGGMLQRCSTCENSIER